MTKPLFVLAMLAILTGCQPGRSLSSDSTTEKVRIMPDLPQVETQLAFSCINDKDRLPKLDPQNAHDGQPSRSLRHWCQYEKMCG